VPQAGHQRGQVQRPVDHLIRAGLHVPQHRLPFGLVQEPDLVGLVHARQLDAQARAELEEYRDTERSVSRSPA
jgi:hypothetical protein